MTNGIDGRKLLKMRAAMKSTGLKVTTPAEREILMTHVFEAPRRRVFDALTRPELVKRWLGPRGWSLSVCEIDLKVGSAYRFAAPGDKESAMGWAGVYREIAPPGRLVHSERFDKPWYPGESLITTLLTEQGGKTTLAATLLYESREARDAVLKTDMKRGVSESYDRLAELLAS